MADKMDRMDSRFLTTDNAPQKDGDEFTLIKKGVSKASKPSAKSWLDEERTCAPFSGDLTEI